MIDDLFVRTTNLRNLCRIQKAKVLAVIRRVPRDDWLVIAWVLASKLLLFLFGIKSFQILEDKHLPTGNGWLEIWNRWDSLIYQRLAQVGYDPNYVWKAWFYPLFPWSVRLAYHFCGDYLTGANHVLPTGGLARCYSGLSTLDFVRWTSYQRVEREAAAQLAEDVGILADAEGLFAHAAAARAWRRP